VADEALTTDSALSALGTTTNAELEEECISLCGQLLGVAARITIEAVVPTVGREALWRRQRSQGRGVAR
jgi:hypothetical protein